MSGGNWKEMFQAIQFDDLALVEYYLNIGIDPNYQHPEFLASPLVESIRYNHLDIAKLLLENGANPHIKEVWGGDTPFSVAKLTGNQEAVKLLHLFMKES